MDKSLHLMKDIPMRSALLFTAALFAVPFAMADLPEPLKSALERPTDTPSFVFDIERTAIQAGGDDDAETSIGYARVDLQADEFKQITPLHLVTPNAPGSSFQALAGIESAIEDGIWCSRYGDNLPEADEIEIVAEDADTVTYEYTPEADGDAEGPDRKIAKKTKVRLTVSRDDPAVLGYERRLTKTVTLYVVAKVRKADGVVVCKRAPDGRTYTSEVSSVFEGGGIADASNTSQMRITAIYDRATGEPLP